jgi:DNA-binding winged helix-turn-helix (wHTH) protein
MTRQRCCNYCGQPLPSIRLGVRLTPLKARIFDIIQRGGRDGVDRCDLFDIVFGDSEVDKKTLKSHVNQINELIEDTGYQIRGRTMIHLAKVAT